MAVHVGNYRCELLILEYMYIAKLFSSYSLKFCVLALRTPCRLVLFLNCREYKTCTLLSF